MPETNTMQCFYLDIPQRRSPVLCKAADLSMGKADNLIVPGATVATISTASS